MHTLELGDGYMGLVYDGQELALGFEEGFSLQAPFILMALLSVLTLLMQLGLLREASSHKPEQQG